MFCDHGLLNDAVYNSASNFRTIGELERMSKEAAVA